MEIKLKQVGQNMITVIDGKTYTKKMADAKDRDSLKNKVLLYNKKPSDTLKKTILKIVDTTIIKKEVTKAKAKGISKSIKKETKKISKGKSKIAPKKDLVSQVETEFKEGNFTKEEITRLEDLLRKKKAEVEKKAEVKEKDNSNGGSRERYR